MAVIGVLCCNTMAFAAPKPLEEAYEKNGNSYIKKTYVINNTEEIFDTMDTTFELNGLVYHQIDISSTGGRGIDKGCETDRRNNSSIPE